MATILETFNQALQHHQAGRFQEAETLYRQILQAQPGHADALHLLGMLFFQAGRPDAAIDFINQAITRNPGNATFYNNIGEAYRVLGKLDDAAASYRQALALRPTYADPCMNLGIVLFAQSRLDEAAAHFRQAIACKPAWAEAYNNLGSVLAKQGALDAAIAHFRQAIAHNAACVEAYNNLGLMLAGRGALDEAIAHFRQAIAHKTDYAEAYNHLGAALAERGELDEAIAQCRRAIVHRPVFPEAYNTLGIALSGQGKLEEAAGLYRQALAAKPDYVDACVNLGNVLQWQGRLEEALEQYRHALVLKPDNAVAHGNLASALQRQGRLQEAVAAYRRALAIKPDYAEAHGNLGNALHAQGRLEEAVAHFRQALALKPDCTDAHSSLLWCLHYSQASDSAALFAQHREWNARYARGLAATILPHGNRREADRRLRVGYVSADFMRHSIRHVVEPVLAMHDKAQVEVYCYSMVVKADDVTARMKTHADHWRPICGMNDAEVARLIRADEIDILVDLSGHTAGNRLLVFARKPAPVQATWAGYCNTTGLEVMDYLITDRYLSPPEGGQLFTEQLIRLPGCRFCYSVPEDAPPVTPGPVRTRGYPTFGCFNNLPKVNAEVIATWSKILQRVPGARLILKTLSLNDRATRERYQQLFGEHGIEPERVELLGSSPPAELLAHYGRIDIALDPFPSPGGVTTCEALWMGAPVITLRGTTLLSGVGVSLLSNVGMPELIAESREHYVELAVQLSHDVERLVRVREGLRARMAASPLCDAVTFTRNLEQAYREMWRTWCARGDGGTDPTKG
jgi:predicted O-linked N-acetylglucosamine transferase (SPINDLY family)